MQYTNTWLHGKLDEFSAYHTVGYTGFYPHQEESLKYSKVVTLRSEVTRCLSVLSNVNSVKIWKHVEFDSEVCDLIGVRLFKCCSCLMCDTVVSILIHYCNSIWMTINNKHIICVNGEVKSCSVLNDSNLHNWSVRYKHRHFHLKLTAGKDYHLINPNHQKDHNYHSVSNSLLDRSHSSIDGANRHCFIQSVTHYISA